MAHRTDAFLGVVLDHAGVGEGPRAGLSYTVDVNFPEGSQTITGIMPAKERWPDTLDVSPILTNTAVWIASVRGNLQLMDRELPSFSPCDQGVRRSFPMDLGPLIAALATATPREKALLREVLK